MTAVRTTQALCLLSGSLDSQLAVQVLQRQHIRVRGLVFTSPFFDTSSARLAASHLGVPLRSVDFTSTMVRLLNEPENGSPFPLCCRCRQEMLRAACALLQEEGCRFLATGEVLEQRLPGQGRDTLELVAVSCGQADYVLRPLSAHLLPETEPERRRWVDRSALLGLWGKCRKEAERLADEYGLQSYPGHSGLCRFQEDSFRDRVADVLAHEGFGAAGPLPLIATGRHFRLGPATKLVVGRNEQENAMIEGAAELYDILLKPEGIQGPTGIVPFTATEEEMTLAAAICARYSDAAPQQKVWVRLRSSRRARLVEVQPVERTSLDRCRI